MKINYNEIKDYQKYWKECESLTQEQRQGLIELSNKLIERAEQNDGELDEIKLFIPKILMVVIEFFPNLQIVCVHVLL